MVASFTICNTATSASRPTSRLPSRSCQPITRSGIDRAHGDDVIEVQAQRQKLGKSRRQVTDNTESRLRHAAVEIGTDHVGQQAIIHGAADEIEIEVAAGVTHVENDAALLGFASRNEEAARWIDNGRLLRRVAVSDHVPGSKGVDDLFHRYAGVADVNHHGRSTSVTGLNRETQSLTPVIPHSFFVQPHLNADAHVRRFRYTRSSCFRIGKAQIL